MKIMSVDITCFSVKNMFNAMLLCILKQIIINEMLYYVRLDVNKYTVAAADPQQHKLKLQSQYNDFLVDVLGYSLH